MKYTEVAKINVNEHIEKKNGLSYLSWAWAVDQLMKLDENASWSYPEPKMYGETMMIFCTVKAFGRERTAQLPVMDYRNKPIPNPNAFEVNTAMQRCLAKAIALHGLGLYIYAGEDLPEGEETEKKKNEDERKNVRITPAEEAWKSLSKDEQKEAEKIGSRIVDLWNADKKFAAYEAFYESNLSIEMQAGVWYTLKNHSAMRTELKAMKDTANQKKAA